MTNTTKPVDFTKPVKYRNGESCRILCTDSNDQTYPVISQTSCGELHTHTSSGCVYSSDPMDIHSHDIVQDVQQTKKYYSLFEQSGVSISYESLQEARNSKSSGVVSILCIIYEDNKPVSSEILSLQEDKPAKVSEF